MDSRIIQRNLTRQKRKTQTCKVFEIKIDKSSLSKSSANHLYRLFLESKWFYNHCLSQPEIFKIDTKVKNVPVKVKDVFETRELTVLSSQMKQAVATRLKDSVVALSRLKKQGRKTGRLKFKSQLNSVPLKQYQNTYDVDFKNNRIKLQGLKPLLKVRGLEQISQNSEIANAVLLRKADGYYFKITVYVDKVEKDIPEQVIGIDFGCQTQLTFSNGVKVEFQVPVNETIRRLDRRIDKKVSGKIGKHRGSKNREKLKEERRRAYLKDANKRKDIRNKVVSVITNKGKYVCFQDESISAWKAGGHGTKIQFSGIGGIIADLKHKSHTPLEVNKYFPSTQLCPQCGTKNKIKIEERIYICPNCGYKEDRDVKSAVCIEVEGLKQIPTDHRIKSWERISSAELFNLLSNIDGLVVSKTTSLSKEAPPFRAGVDH